MTKVFNATELKTLVLEQQSSQCSNYASHNFSCRETILSTFDRAAIKMVGTLQVPDAPENWDEDHPYNSSDVYQCAACQTVYLRYTKYGSYYVDERVRVVKPELVAESND